MTAHTYPSEVESDFIRRLPTGDPLRDHLARIYRDSQRDGTDLWDAVEDDPELDDAQKLRIHVEVFGDDEQTARAKQAAGVRHG